MKHFLAILFLLFGYIGFSQTNMIPYSRDYDFSEGVFLTIHQLKSNIPIPKSSIVSDIPKGEVDFLKQVVGKHKIVYRDSYDNSNTIESSSIWGYCQNRNIYINYNNDFNRVNVIGTLCQFTAMVIASPGFNDPMFSNYGLNTNVEELKQFIFDTQTNKILSMDVKNVSSLLKDDEALYARYMELGKREKTDSQFIYLRKYNEKHPLMLPGK